jgi:Cys-tRNA(Pro)/Cys-tRNA(Cys) deacylase
MARKATTDASTPATTALARAAVAFTVHPYEHDPATTAYGDEAVAALGVPGERVFKTLVVRVDGRLAVAVVPVARQLDLKAFAASLGGKRATLAERADAERTSGYVIGGISPLGQRRRLPTIVDATAADLATMYVSAGRRGAQIELAPADLLRLTGATGAPIAR